MDRRISILLVALSLPLLAAGCGSNHSARKSTSTTTAQGAPVKTIDPANFVRTIDNPYFPLRPGSVWRYRGVKDGKPTVDVQKATNRTKDILGVHATVVTDQLFQHGKVVEDTIDWYAQDRQGNVWYFGEDTKELDRHGKVTSTEGSWQSGVKGAGPGIFMPAHLRVGQSFAQEHYRGQAEDHFQVLDLASKVTTPYASSRRALRTKEWTPLEPGVIDNKYYLRGVGTVDEITRKGPFERNTLVSFKRG